MRFPSTRFGRAIRKLIKSERGAVYTEAAMTLPFFIMIWAFMIFSHKLVYQKITNNALAKGCTWHYALSSCGENPAYPALPASCGGTTFSTAPPAEWNDSSVTAFIREVPFIGDIVLGKASYGTRSASVAKPNYIGGGNRSFDARHSMSCNERPKTIGDLLSNIWSLFSGLF
ncbi:MAG: hypothetical protein JNK05_14465 [Myxococcales bacterium]|nr:hypothetical protein [Myxococcales bacterium]